MTNPTHIPDWKLERFRLGELSEKEMAAIQQAVETDPELQARLGELDISDAEIHQTYPTRWATKRITARLDETEVPGVSRARWASHLSLAAVIMLAVGVSLWFPGYAPDELEKTRLKGSDPELMLHRKTLTGTEQLPDSSTVNPGDLIQIQYRSADKSFGTILSVDGHGIVSQHLPDSGAAAAQLIQGNPVSLDFAYELDDAPKWERFYFITADTPFDIKAVMQAAKGASDTLQIDNTFVQYVITLYKNPH